MFSISVPFVTSHCGTGQDDLCGHYPHVACKAAFTFPVTRKLPFYTGNLESHLSVSPRADFLPYYDQHAGIISNLHMLKLFYFPIPLIEIYI